MKKYNFHVAGMHCQSCVVLTESELKEHKCVCGVKAFLGDCSVEVEGDFKDASPEAVAAELSAALEKHGYHLLVEKPKRSVRWADFKIAVPAALGFVALFLILQKLGIVNLVSGGDVTYGTAFIIGLIASLSTCMAVVGGLVLSVSANFAKEGDKVRPQSFFHIGRFASFFILGGAIGAAGSIFQFGNWGAFWLNLLVGVVMLILGINLMDIFPWAKRFQPTMPRFISRHILGLEKINHTLTPFLVGAVTFFLPCGFTQSMQIFTLSTGSFLAGALTMSAFAAGTFPVLALLSFASLGFHNKLQSGIFFKTAGLVVIFFALFNIINSLVVIGWLPPVFNF